MFKNPNLVLKVLNVIVYIVFIGMCIKAGALLFSYILSMNNAIAAQNLYDNLDLSDLKIKDEVAYSIMFFSIFVIVFLQALLFYTIIIMFKKIDIISPFHETIGNLIKRMAGFSLVIGIFSNVTLSFVVKYISQGLEFPNIMKYVAQGDAFVFFAMILFFISMLFDKGIALQNEAEFTI